MKKILLVVDMQNDFISGSLGNEQAKGIVENVQKKIQRYNDNGYIIIFTQDTHNEGYLHTQEGRLLPVTHCMSGTPGWQIADGLYVAGAKTYEKHSFGSIELAEYIYNNYHDVNEIEIIGLCTDICVISNAIILKAKLPEAKIVIDAGCCAGVTPKSHTNALEAMKMCQIYVTN